MEAKRLVQLRPPPLDSFQRERFEQLVNAVDTSVVSLVSAIDKYTGAPCAVVCVRQGGAWLPLARLVERREEVETGAELG